jgi:hypothetical protein
VPLSAMWCYFRQVLRPRAAGAGKDGIWPKPREEACLSVLSRNAQVLRYLLEVAPGIGHTKLAKFAYLADLEAWKHLGRPISHFNYVRAAHGPFDGRAFYAARDELVMRGMITDAQTQYGDYLTYQMNPTDRGVEYCFSPPEMEILRYVAETYLEKTARDLCDDVVYKTAPMQNAKEGRHLEMKKVIRKPTIRHEYGFKLERMIAGEASAKAGRFQPLAKVLSGLRARFN